MTVRALFLDAFRRTSGAVSRVLFLAFQGIIKKKLGSLGCFTGFQLSLRFHGGLGRFNQDASGHYRAYQREFHFGGLYRLSGKLWENF